MNYVYPVISRRAGGVSVGINLNTNNACNWRCVYCQVPDLTLGAAPAVEMGLLESELRALLHEMVQGDFMAQRVPENMRVIKDIALSGNGEPTSAVEFAQVVALMAKIKRELELPEAVKLVLITNGSLLYRPAVQNGLKQLGRHNGEVWFKLDRVSEHSRLRVNNTQISLKNIRENLQTSLSLCPNTWLQTCWFAWDDAAPTRQEEEDYLNFLEVLRQSGTAPRGVLLYGLARDSLQPEAAHLRALSLEQMESFASRIRQLGLSVRVSV